MTAIYNEIEPYPAQWMRNLIAAGRIAPGVVDERSIAELDPADVAGPGQRHFFAGIGVWSYALRLAGWPDDRDVWTGSCPCQPFSGAGRRRGFADERHLWPEWFRLIRECRPAIVFGEQVAVPDGLGWFDVVRADLESAGYAVGAADLCAAGVGAPHIRQRLYFVAVADLQPGDVHAPQREPGRGVLDGCPGRGGAAGELGDTELHDRTGRLAGSHGRQEVEPDRSGATRGFWSPADWIPCRDGKARPVEPGAFPLAHGAPARMGRLRATGNAIVPQVAAAFISSVMDALGHRESP